ncbi:MAG TPA: serine/threonine-protein kinase, partial [Polyangiales bacterium]|nr:serine/threonine-protein kinase [Polyangiales bacterium]
MATSSVPDRIADRYVVHETLGQGGMGSVYRVFDERTGHECALKQLSAKAGADPMVAELFEREFHTLSELAHPSIIEVYDYGIDGDRAYYTMELLAGQDLRSLGTLHWRKACEVLRDLASALAIVHSRRLIHCDISPRNVNCTADGRAKLLDFGAMVPMGVAK